MRKIIGHIDINNCYVSCERLFQPKLNDKIVVVLSNNDGCVIARSQEAKTAKIPMGMPFFELEKLIKEQKLDITYLSSNYAVYGEMSRRFHQLIEDMLSPDSVEQYSIDESFFDLTDFTSVYEPTKFANSVKDRIDSWLGLPVCVGLGHTKTQSKFANHLAKKIPVFNGVCNLIELANQGAIEGFYNIIDVSEVWGVGRQYKKRLNELGIVTAGDLKRANPEMIGRLFGVVLKRTVMELNGEPCIDLETDPEPQKQIISSKSFGKRITDVNDLKEAITRFTHDAQKRLLKSEQVCGVVTVFASSNPFDTNNPYYKKGLSCGFEQPTDNPQRLISVAARLIEKLYVEGVSFKKCGVVLTGLEPKSSFNHDLFSDRDQDQKSDNLVKVIEDIHKLYGKKKLGFGASYMDHRAWSMRQSYKTPNYFDIQGDGWVLNEIQP
ncbi:Y-family DNA polymerase [Acinetobacter ursingii]|nr:Y-family DNA polymerase [Acinetobacter ursingii]